MIPLTGLRRDLIAVIDKSQRLERDMLNQYALPYGDGHLVMDFELLEDDLRALQGAVSTALMSVAAVVALAEEDDARHWDNVREMAA